MVEGVKLSLLMLSVCLLSDVYPELKQHYWNLLDNQSHLCMIS